MKISIINCFCDETLNSGNPAAVVVNFEGADAERQALAIHLYVTKQMPVTVFLDQEHNKHTIRFFYPSLEMNMCIHGTLAAAYLILASSDQSTCTLITRDNNEIHIVREGNRLQAVLKEKRTDEIRLDNQAIASLLNLPNDFAISSNLPAGVFSVGSPKYLIPLNSDEQLQIIEPNFAAITHWSNEAGVNGLYVYVPISNSNNAFKARGFNPKGGCNEDAATGVAVGALVSALQAPHITVLQGESIGHPCRLIGSLRKNKDNEDILVGGIVQYDHS